MIATILSNRTCHPLRTTFHAVRGGIASLIVWTLLPMPALAGSPGTITFGPAGATSVPALGSVALLLLALMLGFAGWVSLRRNGPGTSSSVMLAVALLAGSGAGGLQWFERVEAAGSSFTILNAAGQSFSVNPIDINFYDNNTSVSMQPTSIVLAGCPLQTTAQTCAVGTPLAPGGICELDCTIADSDERLKEAIARVATAPNGLPVYEYRYRGHAEVYRGVMAQDVLFHTPEAVHLRPTGYLAVDYGMLGLQLERIR